MSGVPPFLWQSALILLAAYFSGAWIGCLLRRLLTRRPKVVMVGNVATTAAPMTVSGARRVSPGARENRFDRALEGYPGGANAALRRDEPAMSEPFQTAGAAPVEVRPDDCTLLTSSRQPADARVQASALEPQTRDAQAGQGTVAEGIAAVGSGELAAAAVASHESKEAVAPRDSGAAEMGQSGATRPTKPDNTMAVRMEALPDGGRPTANGDKATAGRLEPSQDQQRGAEPIARTPAETRTRTLAVPPAAPDRPAVPRGQGGQPQRERPGAAPPVGMPSTAESARHTPVPLQPSATQPAEPKVAASPERAEQTRLSGAAVVGAATVAVPASDGGSPSPSAPAASPAPAPADNLLSINGVTEEDAVVLNRAGITTCRQIAAWTRDDLDKLPDILGGRRRIAQENWIEQADLLAQGTPTAYVRHLREGSAASPASRTPEAAPPAAGLSPQPPATPQRTAQAGEPTAVPAIPRPQSVASSAGGEGFRSVRSEALLGRAAAGPQRMDDLKQIRGISALIEDRLNMMGYTSYAQIAAWSQADIDRVSQQLDFRGRIERENWIEQARILARGGQNEFSRHQDRDVT